MELARKSRKAGEAKRAKKKAVKKKPAASKAARTRTEMNTPKGTRLRPIRATEPPLRKMKGGENLSARAGQVDPTKRTPKQPTRTAAQRAAEKKRLLAEQKKVRAAGKKKSLTRFIPGSPRVKGTFGAENVGSGLRIGGEALLTAAALAGSGGTAAPAVAGTRGGKLVLNVLSKAKKLLKGKPKPKPKPSTATTPARPSGTPAKPSGRGPASGGRKASGPGSRSRTRRTSAESPSKKIQRQKKRDAKKTERRERLDSGGVRVGIQKRKSALTRGRRTQAQKRADRQKRKRYNL